MKPSDAPRMALPDPFVTALQDRFGARFSRGESVCLQHGRDESALAPAPPDGVVFADGTEDVSWLAACCHAHGVPLIAFGTGSSLEGHLLAIRGGISVDLSAMNRILALRPEDMDATVQPGVTRKALNDAIRDTGLFFPIDPGADASIGGMAATRASGTNAVRYGTMREAVMALEVVLADGQVIRTGSRARKSAAGYDLTRLFVGSEGTLGIITELTLRLFPVPESIASATCCFSEIEPAVRTVIETIQLGVPIARIELLDALTIRAINRHSRLTLPEKPTLFFEFHGSPAGVREQVAQVESLAGDNGGDAFAWATRPEDRSRLWQARHDAYFACLQLAPGARSLTTDVCVPISRLAECIAGTRDAIAASGLPVPLLGHVGDGNFHLLVLAHPDRQDEATRAAELSRAVVEQALALGGTCTGEHGVGLGKRQYLPLEHGEPAVEVMRRIKRALDPAGILNPGKIV
jgi:D-lactate dehydrogenase (cytochrome)